MFYCWCFICVEFSIAFIATFGIGSTESSHPKSRIEMCFVAFHQSIEVVFLIAESFIFFIMPNWYRLVVERQKSYMLACVVECMWKTLSLFLFGYTSCLINPKKGDNWIKWNKRGSIKYIAKCCHFSMIWFCHIQSQLSNQRVG